MKGLPTPDGNEARALQIAPSPEHYAKRTKPRVSMGAAAFPSRRQTRRGGYSDGWERCPSIADCHSNRMAAGEPEQRQFGLSTIPDATSPYSPSALAR